MALALAGLAGLAFLLRVVPPLLLPFAFSGPDTITYLAPAEHLAAGGGYTEADGSPATARPPGYPAFLALVFAMVGGPSLAAARIAQALLGAAAVPCVYAAVAARGGPRVGLGAAALLAVDPIAIGQSPFILREALLLTLLAALMAVHARARGPLRYGGTGLLLAGLALTHQLYVLLGPFLFLGDVLAAPRGRRLARVRPWLGVGLLVALAVTLWAARNERVGGRFSFTLAANAVPARELWLTTEYSNAWLSGDDDTGFQALAWAEETRLMEERGLEGTKRELYRRAWENLRDHPLRTLARVLRLNAWYWAEVPGAVRLADHPRLQVARWVLLPFHWVRLACAAAGVVWLLRTGRWRTWRLELAGLAFFALAPALLYPVPRYLAPACPLLDALAGIGLAASLGRRAAERA